MKDSFSVLFDKIDRENFEKWVFDKYPNIESNDYNVFNSYLNDGFIYKVMDKRLNIIFDVDKSTEKEQKLNELFSWIDSELKVNNLFIKIYSDSSGVISSEYEKFKKKRYYNVWFIESYYRCIR